MRKTRIAMYKGLGGHGTLGLEIVLSVLLGLFGGRWLDARYGTGPWLTALGVFFGVGAAVRSVQRVQRELRAISEREEREAGNPAPLYATPKDRLAELESRRFEAERLELARGSKGETAEEAEAAGGDERRHAEEPRARRSGDVGEA